MSDQVGLEREKGKEGSGLSPGQFWHSYRRFPYIFAKTALVIAVLFGVFWLLKHIERALFPVVAAILLAYLLDPLIDWFETKKIKRTFGILLTLTAGLLGFGVFAIVLYPVIAKQVINVVERVPQIMALIENDFLPWIEYTFHVDVPDTLLDAVFEYGDEIKSQAPVIAEKVGQWLGEIVGQTPTLVMALLYFVMIPIFTFYFLRDFDRMRLASVQFIPEKRRDVIIDRLKRMDKVVGAWFRGQLQVSGILAILYGLGLGVLFELYGLGFLTGLALGVLTGLLNVIPYLGFAVGSIIAFLIVIIDWQGIGLLLGVAGVFAVVQTVESYYITPKVLGDKVGLSPVMVIIVLLIGGEGLGLIGVILAIPVTASVKTLMPDIIEWYKNTGLYTGRYDDIHRPHLDDAETSEGQGELFEEDQQESAHTTESSDDEPPLPSDASLTPVAGSPVHSSDATETPVAGIAVESSVDSKASDSVSSEQSSVDSKKSDDESPGQSSGDSKASDSVSPGQSAEDESDS